MIPFGILHATSSSDKQVFDEFLMLLRQQLIAPPGFEPQSNPPQLPHSCLQQTSSIIRPFLQKSKLEKIEYLWLEYTGIPRLTRFLWQPKNRVRRNSRYASQSIEKKIVKKICITRKSYTIKSCYANFFGQAQKTA